MNVEDIGTPEWLDSAERSEWGFMAKMLREASDALPHKLSGIGVAIDIADSRSKEGWRTIPVTNDPNRERWDYFEILIQNMRYKPGWYFRTGIELGGPDGSRMWLQIGVTEEAEISWDMIAGKKVPWRGAKHYLSAHMCRNEVVSTAFHAVLRAEEHEVREWFRYAEPSKKPRALFNPHLDPDALARLAGKAENFDTRRNAMTME